jgi:hypothetical protein
MDGDGSTRDRTVAPFPPMTAPLSFAVGGMMGFKFAVLVIAVPEVR